ncbi:MAG TPA: hypothetical protein VMV45_08945 [Casimicrobiaceae bacterium]|nr:hypothetical protein [Casimicrobiaceae bacterium]
MRLLVLLLAAFLAFGAHAHSVLPLDLDTLVDRSDQIVYVRCLGNQAVPDATLGVATLTTFVVFDRAKGLPGSTLTLRQAGGELNGLAVRYPVPSFRVGEEYVLFVPPVSRLGFASPVGLAQGVFHVVPGAAGKEVGNGRDLADLMPSADVATLPPRTASRLKSAPQVRTRFDLADFMTIVRSRPGTR